MESKACVYVNNQKIIFLLLLLFHVINLSTSTDTITINQTLKDGDLLISNSNSYALGFFSPGGGKRYVGIWYQNIPEQMIIWVANRDNPVYGRNGTLYIDNATGELVIRDNNTKTTVWNMSIYSAMRPAEGKKWYYSAKLRDTGDLVLYRGGAATWRSFDHPTDTVVSEQRLGVDKKRGLNMSLRSWRSWDDPSVGEFSLGFEFKGKPQAFLYKNSTPVWRLGPLNGVRWSGIPEMTPSITPYTFIENDDEVWVESKTRDPSIYSIVMLNQSGTLSKIIWQSDKNDDDRTKKWVGMWYFPNDDCDYYTRCGPFSICNPYNNKNQGDFECRCIPGFEPKSRQEWGLRNGKNGCIRRHREGNNIIGCRKGDGFVKMEHMKVPDTGMARVDRAMGLRQCREVCLNNCSCTAYATANIRNGGSGCITWYGELIDMREFCEGGQDLYIRVSASYLAQPNKEKTKELHGKRLIIVIVVVPIVALIIFMLFYLRTKLMRQGNETLHNTILQSYEEPQTLGKHMDGTLPSAVLVFNLNIIKVATNNFATRNKLGEGGFGIVYKGELQNGQLVAIKRLTRTSRQGTEEFKNEVTSLAKLQHRNLVRLLGCCIEQGEKMLVFEFLPNKSLDRFIFGNTHGVLLDWKKRFEIISEIAQGLLYLHQDSRLRIIHRDLKASNVLLDASMHPKISDFGMAKIFGEDQIEADTNRVVGTYGYMSPEYAMNGHYSIKSDVFSFGVLLLEIVSGKKNKYKHKENSMSLIRDAWNFWNDGSAFDIINPSLGDSYDDQEVLRCIHVGLLCVQPLPNDRPIMSEVIFMLTNDTELPYPNPPEFIFQKGNTFLFSSNIYSRNQSINSMSITDMEGR